MSAEIIPIPRAFRLVIIQPCQEGFAIAYLPPEGGRKPLGVRSDLAAARLLAGNEAFKIGKCRVQVLADGGRA
ncbi:hypothetical protein [Lichenibacterium ramalinae]|uniref:Uncharacterized protein n=1 Tax=Lichenibacterium ramalinae TaxID=2316527 RepID=A0A4V1RHW0_9HYPH|nr:hypothetical protein [Lichenibacterium ramalinae]RYB01417.1 hypothetical protein D3272_26185 [Lichenibacterium ramalinae]